MKKKRIYEFGNRKSATLIGSTKTIKKPSSPQRKRAAKIIGNLEKND